MEGEQLTPVSVAQCVMGTSDHWIVMLWLAQLIMSHDIRMSPDASIDHQILIKFHKPIISYEKN